MQNYELIYIISGEVPDKENQPIKDKVNKLIQKNNGKIEKEDILGRRQLAYQIKKQKYGFYIVVNFSLQPEDVSKMESDLKLIEEVIRYLITIIKAPVSEKKKKTIKKPIKKIEVKKEPKAKEGKLEEKVMEKIKEKPLKFTQGKSFDSSTKLTASKSQDKPFDSTQDKPKKEDKVEEKKRMKELDEKLDEILHKDEGTDK